MERWKPVKGYEKRYHVSDKGRVYSVLNDCVLRPAIDVNGYEIVSLADGHARKCVKVHRLVAEAFIPNAENKPTVNHIDEDKRNNDVSNLEWATWAEQNAHGTRLLRAARSRMRPVLQMTASGEAIKIWNGAVEAQRALGIRKTGIWSCCEGRTKTAGGYAWKRI